MYKNNIVTQVVAVNNKGYIGKDDTLMWYNKEDLQNFKKLTMWNVLLVGRKTYDTLPKAVHQGRVLIPISRSGDSIESAFEKADKVANNENIFIIGGGEIYKETFSYTDYIYVSHIDDDQIGDTVFTVPDDFELFTTHKMETFELKIYKKCKNGLCTLSKNSIATGTFELEMS